MLSRSCPTNNYLIALQPGVSSSDFIDTKNAPLLSKLTNNNDKSHTANWVGDVLGGIDTYTLQQALSKGCNITPITLDSSSLHVPEPENTSEAHIVFTRLPALQSDLSEDERHVIMRQLDEFLSDIVETYFQNKDYTLVYTTTSKASESGKVPASETTEYDSELPLADMMHNGELRRSLIARKEKQHNNQTMVDGPLFDKYQFLSPGAFAKWSARLLLIRLIGIFMGLLISFVLVMILYVGISALSSLQVTYGAFDKEQGQLAAKKGQ